MAEYIDKGELYSKICERVNTPVIRNWLGAIISETPAADVAPVKRGKWIMKSFHKGVCNQCHRLDDIDPLATHCRYCGSKMDLEE